MICSCSPRRRCIVSSHFFRCLMALINRLKLSVLMLLVWRVSSDSPINTSPVDFVYWSGDFSSFSKHVDCHFTWFPSTEVAPFVEPRCFRGIAAGISSPSAVLSQALSNAHASKYYGRRSVLRSICLPIRGTTRAQKQ